MAAVIAAACAVASPLASARADEVVATPVAGSDLGSSSPTTQDPDPNQGSTESGQPPANGDPASGQQPPEGGQPPSSPPPDTGGGADSSGDAGTSADTPADTSADGGATDSSSARDDGATRPSTSEAQHESGATASPTTDLGYGAGGAGGAPPTSPPTSNAAPPDPAATAQAPIMAPTAPAGTGLEMTFLGIDTGGMSLLVPHSVRCVFCYRGVRFAVWLAGTASGSQLQRRSPAQAGGAKASALSLIAFAWAPDPLTAQLFRLLGGGGGTAALLLFGFLAVLAGMVLPASDWTRAFRISTVTWRPSPYVRPLELPG